MVDDIYIKISKNLGENRKGLKKISGQEDARMMQAPCRGGGGGGVYMRQAYSRYSDFSAVRGASAGARAAAPAVPSWFLLRREGGWRKAEGDAVDADVSVGAWGDDNLVMSAPQRRGEG